MKGNDAFLYGDDCEIIGLNQRKPRKQGDPTGLVHFFIKYVTSNLLVLYQS